MSKRDKALYWIGRMNPAELRDFCRDTGATLDGIADAIAATAPKAVWEVVLTNDAERKIQAIKIVRMHTGLGLKEAKDAVDGAPYRPVLTTEDESLALRLADDLRREGMTAIARRAA